MAEILPIGGMMRARRPHNVRDDLSIFEVEMITSQKQYLAEKEKVTMLKAELTRQKKPSVPDVLASAHDAQISELISEIEGEISGYEALKNAQVSDTK